MLISAIAAVSRNSIIGKDNEIPWYLPGDLAFFKRTTLGHCIIMGRNSFRSIGQALPKRTNIVVTRDPFFTADGVVVVHSIEEALHYAFDTGEKEAFVNGGGDIYRQTASMWDRIYLTEVDVTLDGDVSFPQIDPLEWRELSREWHAPDDKNVYAYTFRVLERANMGDQVRPGPSSH
jgi:dihydrofolate reductase